jgi:hypothetical protein
LTLLVLLPPALLIGLAFGLNENDGTAARSSCRAKLGLRTEPPPAVMHGLSFAAETIRGQKISGEAEALKYKPTKKFS